MTTKELVTSYKQLKEGDIVTTAHTGYGHGKVTEILTPNFETNGGGYVEIHFRKLDNVIRITGQRMYISRLYGIDIKGNKVLGMRCTICTETVYGNTHLYKLVTYLPKVCIVCGKWCKDCECKICKVKRKELSQASFLETLKVESKSEQYT